MLSNDLAAWRSGHGWKQRQVAALLTRERGSTVYQHQVSHWERGESVSKTTEALLRRVMAKHPAPKRPKRSTRRRSPANTDRDRR